MENEEHIVSYTADELDEMLRRGEDETDWKRLRTMTDEELEASIDHEDEGEFDWSTVYVNVPGTNEQRAVRLDPEIVAWFKEHGPGDKARMNAVPRSSVDAQAKQERAKAGTPRR